MNNKPYSVFPNNEIIHSNGVSIVNGTYSSQQQLQGDQGFRASKASRGFRETKETREIPVSEFQLFLIQAKHICSFICHLVAFNGLKCLLHQATIILITLQIIFRLVMIFVLPHLLADILQSKIFIDSIRQL